MFIRTTAVDEIKEETEETEVYDSVQISNDKINKTWVKWLQNVKWKSWSMQVALSDCLSEVSLAWLEKMETTWKRIKPIKWLHFRDKDTESGIL